jgi:hypothetical protein
MAGGLSVVADRRNAFGEWLYGLVFCVRILLAHSGREMKNKIAETRKFPEKFVYSLFLILSADGGSG